MTPGEAALVLSCAVCGAPVSAMTRKPWHFRCRPCMLVLRPADIGSLQHAITRRAGIAERRPAPGRRIRGDVSVADEAALALRCWVCAGPVSAALRNGCWRFRCDPCATALRPWPGEIQLQQAIIRRIAARAAAGHG